jgi:hypothetical protein
MATLAQQPQVATTAEDLGEQPEEAGAEAEVRRTP